MEPFDNNSNQSLSTIIFDKIRDNILSNKYIIGEKLIESKLAEEFGVSRTPVREALKQLELEGLIDNLPNRGMVVNGVSKQDVEDIYAIRTEIESIAAKWAIERMDQQLVKDLTEIYDLMEFYTYKDDCDKLFELSTMFHETIYKATQSRYLEQMLSDYQLYIKLSRSNSLRCSGRIKEALTEYKEILDGFTEKNVESACKAMLDHINHIRH